MRMTTEEAFVKVLQMHGIEHAFGIIGSAMMPISDLFPAAGITFWDCAHEGNAGMMADGYTRATGKMCMAIAQNGPGITNFVTPIKTAYWNHTPLLLVTPQAANKTIGQGGFQEIEQMALFRDMVCLPGGGARSVAHRRGAEPGDREGVARLGAGADQRAARLLDPGDRHRAAADRSASSGRAAGREAIAEAARLLAAARFPVILNGAGVVLAGAIAASRALAERLGAGRLRLPAQRRLSGHRIRCRVGPLGYNGSKAAMELIAQADVVLALGHAAQPVLDAARLRHRLLAEGREDHPGRHQPRPHRSDQEGDRGDPGRREAGRRADAGGARAGGGRCRAGGARGADRADAVGLAAAARRRWTTRTTIRARPGTRGRGRRSRSGCRPRMAWRAIQAALPKEAIISSDIGNNCAIGNAYPTFEQGRKYLAPGLFGPCGYGFPAILGAKIGGPDVPVVGFAGDGAFGISVNEMTACGRDELAGDHHGDLPQLPVGRGEAQHDALVRRQFRRHRARPRTSTMRRSRGPAG